MSQLRARQVRFGEQFIEYIVNVFTLNFGESYVYSQSVSSLIADYFWPTVLLTGRAAILAIVLGLWLGTRAGWKRNSRFDKIVSSSVTGVLVSADVLARADPAHGLRRHPPMVPDRWHGFA